MTSQPAPEKLRSRHKGVIVLGAPEWYFVEQKFTPQEFEAIRAAAFTSTQCPYPTCVDLDKAGEVGERLKTVIEDRRKRALADVAGSS